MTTGKTMTVRDFWSEKPVTMSVESDDCKTVRLVAGKDSVAMTETETRALVNLLARGYPCIHTEDLKATKSAEDYIIAFGMNDYLVDKRAAKRLYDTVNWILTIGRSA